MMKTKIENLLTACIFVGMLWLALIVSLTSPDEKSSETENRSLASRPDFSMTNSDKFASQFERYYSDHFGFRESLVSNFNVLIDFLGGKRRPADVTLGDDNWSFLGEISVGYRKYSDPIGSWLGQHLFEDNKLLAAAIDLQKTSDWLAQQGIAYIYVVAPNKHTIYSEKLPSYIRNYATQHRVTSMDVWIDYLKSNTTVNVIDLRPLLIKGKVSKQVYYKQDTHWNTHGANIAQAEIINLARQKLDRVDATTPIALHSKFTQKPQKNPDLARIASMKIVNDNADEPIFEGGCTPHFSGPREDKYSECQSGKYRALVYRDSFFTAIEPYFSRRFEFARYIWIDRGGKATLTEALQDDDYNIVIEEMVERQLPRVWRNINTGEF